jgi:hypothetical protein
MISKILIFMITKSDSKFRIQKFQIENSKLKANIINIDIDQS